MVNGLGMNGNGMGLALSGAEGMPPMGPQSPFSALGMPPMGMLGQPPMPAYRRITDPILPVFDVSPERITALVKAREEDMADLRNRQEADYACWNLEWTDPRWPNGKPDDYATYKSLDPHTFGNRIVDMLGAASMTARVPYAANTKDRRSFGEAKERFFISCLREADELLRLRLQPGLQDSLGWYIALRGWYAGRALLVKSATDGSTRVDISPFDPMNTFWDRTEDGLRWVCHVQYRRPSELRSSYILADDDRLRDDTREDTPVKTYNFYDAVSHSLCTESGWLKEPEPHGAPGIPCFVGASGAAPYIGRLNAATATQDVEAWGPGVFTYVRDMYSVENQTMSDRLTMVRRSLMRPVIIENAGAFRLGKNIWQEGAEVYLPDGAKLNAVDLQEMSRETDPLLSQLSGAIQRGTLSHTSYGQLGQPLSGYAINLLNMGNEFVVRHGIQALRAAYMQIWGLLCAQYATGQFMPIQAEGYRGKQWFSALILPEHVSQADHGEITFRAKMAKDDAGAYQLAKIARDGAERGQQLLSKRYVMDEHLQVQDVDAELEVQREEQGEEMSPLARLVGLIQSAQDRGREDLEMIYAEELQMVRMERAMKLQMMMTPPQGPGPAGQAPGRRQFNPGGQLRPPPPIGPQTPTPEFKVQGPQEQARPPGLP